jgi:segregation and condensation protein B
MVDIKKEIEAILFSAGRAVTITEFQALLSLTSPGLINEAAKEIREEYDSRSSPLMIVEEEGGWKLTVREKFLPIVQRINPHTELSKTILETLSVIAWKQPISQSAVINIRTNKAYDHISELERLGFISKERYGRTFILKVTQKFLDYFDLPNNKAIKDVFTEFKDIEIAVQKKVDEFEKNHPVKIQNLETANAEKENQAEEVKEELQTYTDILPSVVLPKSHSDLEKYDDVAEGSKSGKEDKQSENNILKEKGALKSSINSDESDEEKAKRLAREILGEEKISVSSEEKTKDKRVLHPKLEEFVAGSMNYLKPKLLRSEKRESEKDSASNKIKSKESSKKQGAQENSKKAAEHKDTMTAEEYPGQFSSSENNDDSSSETENDSQ